MVDASFVQQQFPALLQDALNAITQLQLAALSVAFTYSTYVPVSVHSPADMVPIDTGNLPTVSSIQQIFNAIKADPFPQYPTSADLTQIQTYVWKGPQFATLTTAIDDYLASLGMPDSSYQDAIFDADKERKLRAMNDAIDLVQAKTSAQGYKYAQLQTNAAILDITEKYQFDLENQTREITKQMTEWARQAYQFSLQQGLDAEKAQMQFSGLFGTLLLDYFVKTFSLVLEKYKAFVTTAALELKTTIDGIMATAEVYKANATITEAEEKLLYERDRLNVQQSIEQFKGDISDNANRATEQINACGAVAANATGLAKAVSSSDINLNTSTATPAPAGTT
jgi:hypothetical protein